MIIIVSTICSGAFFDTQTQRPQVEEHNVQTIEDLRHRAAFRPLDIENGNDAVRAIKLEWLGV